MLDEFGIYTVSVFLALDASFDELCRDRPELERYGKVGPSAVGRLRSLGFALVLMLDRPHYDVVLPDLADATLDRLESAVAEVVRVEDDGVVLVRVLPGNVDDHRHLLRPLSLPSSTQLDGGGRREALVSCRGDTEPHRYVKSVTTQRHSVSAGVR